jgi:hypothetical protein
MCFSVFSELEGFASVHQEVFEDWPKRERGKEGKRADDKDYAYQ